MFRKRLFCALVCMGLMFLLSGPAFAAGDDLTVTNPSQGDIWCLEKPYTIAWAVGFGEGFGITLMDSTGTKSVHHITSVGSKIREYMWMVPASIPSGKYRVQVTSVAVFEWQTPIVSQSPVFEIRKCDAPDPFKGLIDHLRHLELIEWWRINNPRPFPNPCLSCPPEFDLGKLREIFVKADLKEQVQVELFSGRAKIADLGTFGRGSFPQSTLKLQRIGMTESRTLQGGKGFRLSIRNMQGRIIHTQNIGMKEVAPPARRR